MYSRAKGTADQYWAKGTADQYWPQLVFLSYSGPKGDDILWNNGENLKRIMVRNGMIRGRGSFSI